MKLPESASTRRSFLFQTAGLAAVALVEPRRAGAAPSLATVLETKVISPQTGFYNGWPTLARRKNGDLWVSWSGGRVSHVCPFGQVQAMLSKDEGATWTWPRVLLDSAGDDRDSGVLETTRGTLVVTTFTSNVYQRHLKEGTVFHTHTEKGWISKPISPAELAQWNAADQRLSEAESKAELGEWCIRSTDGGISWSARIPTVVNSPHGPIQLRDGRLLYAGRQLYAGTGRVGVCESKNDGLSWEWLAEIPLRKGDTQRYHELHVVEAANGTLLAHIRNHNDENKGWTLQCESVDGGAHWNEPHPVCYGFPSHLLCLRDGCLLMSYGYRRAPYGNRARVSADNGKSWGEEIVLSADAVDGDLGYTSTVELSDGTLLSVWYESQGENHLGVLRQARWRLG